VTYNAAGQLTKITYGNGTVSDYTYDPQTLRLDQLKTTGPASILQDFSYAFDAVGNVTGITDQVNTGTQSFQYDALNRLSQATGSYGVFSYTYDPLGNMTSKEGAALTYGLPDGTKPHAVTALSNPQLPAADIRLSYDANGNVLEKSVDRGPSAIDWAAQQLQYDAENRLVEVKTAPEETATLTTRWNPGPDKADSIAATAVLAAIEEIATKLNAA
jgi:YD repeat-containing protein